MPAQLVWIGTSWKMNKTIAEARAYVEKLVPALPVEGVQAFVLPPHTALAAVRDAVPATTPLLLGAQNAHWEPEGAGTGEISMRMVRDAGAQLVEIGHSERRQHFGETDETVARKVRAAFDEALVPLVCVGEPESVRAAGDEEEYVTAQVRRATALLSPAEVGRLLVAYEPVWAIGAAGRPATARQVAPVMQAIAAELADRSTGERQSVLLYGGGVDHDNAAELLADPHTDGLFVGRAAWTAEGLVRLLRIGGAYAARGAGGRHGRSLARRIRADGAVPARPIEPRQET